MIPIVPFQKSPSDFLQTRSESRLDVQVRRSSSVPSKRSTGHIFQESMNDEDEILFQRDQCDENNPATVESEKVEVPASKEYTIDDTHCESIKDSVPASKLHIPTAQKTRAAESTCQTKKQESKRIKAKRQRPRRKPACRPAVLLAFC